ncbi:MAG: cell division protein FtsA [Bacteroidales bacterium]|nr:cell division protein FtsA [Bacteroidales bacterium]
MGFFDKITKKHNEGEAFTPEEERTQQHSDIAVGLDIGTTKIVAFAGKRNHNGEVEILGHSLRESIGVQRGQVINITETSNAINFVMNDLNKKLNMNVKDVMVGIAGQHIHSQRIYGDIKRNNPDDVITQEDINHLLEEMFKTPIDAGKQVLDVVPQEYIINTDIRTLEPKGITGRKLGSEFNIITGDINHIRNIGRCVKNSNLNMDSLILEPIASSKVVLDEDEKEIGVALVDIGGGTTDVIVFSDGVMRHSAVIPIASNVISDDIYTVFGGITRDKAEILKIKHGSCMPDDSTKNHLISIPGVHGRPPKTISELELANVIHSRMSEIIERVVAELKNAKCMDMLGCGIVFTGGGSQLKGLKELAEFKTGLTVRIGYPEEKIKISNNEYKNPSFATGLGLMLLGIERNEALYGYPDFNNSYFPEEETEEEKEFEEEDGNNTDTSSTKKGGKEGKGGDGGKKPDKPWLWERLKKILDSMLTDDSYLEDDNFDDDEYEDKEL